MFCLKHKNECRAGSSRLYQWFRNVKEQRFTYSNAWINMLSMRNRVQIIAYNWKSQKKKIKIKNNNKKISAAVADSFLWKSKRLQVSTAFQTSISFIINKPGKRQKAWRRRWTDLSPALCLVCLFCPRALGIRWENRCDRCLIGYSCL